MRLSIQNFLFLTLAVLSLFLVFQPNAFSCGTFSCIAKGQGQATGTVGTVMQGVQTAGSIGSQVAGFDTGKAGAVSNAMGMGWTAVGAGRDAATDFSRCSFPAGLQFCAAGVAEVGVGLMAVKSGVDSFSMATKNQQSMADLGNGGIDTSALDELERQRKEWEERINQDWCQQLPQLCENGPIVDQVENEGPGGVMRRWGVDENVIGMIENNGLDGLKNGTYEKFMNGGIPQDSMGALAALAGGDGSEGAGSYAGGGGFGGGSASGSAAAGANGMTGIHGDTPISASLGDLGGGGAGDSAQTKEGSGDNGMGDFMKMMGSLMNPNGDAKKKDGMNQGLGVGRTVANTRPHAASKDIFQIATEALRRSPRARGAFRYGFHLSRQPK